MPQQLNVTKKRYTDSGGWEKVYLTVRPEKRSELDSLLDRIVSFLEDNKNGRTVFENKFMHYISVTEINTGREDFGQIIDSLVGHLKKTYTVKLTE